MKLYFEKLQERPRNWEIVRYVDDGTPKEDRVDFVMYYKMESLEEIPEPMLKSEAIKYAKDHGYKVKYAKVTPGTGRWGNFGEIVVE